MAEAWTVGYTVTAFGRRRPLPDLVSTNYQVRLAAERQAMNAGIQGLAADLFKLALIRLDRGIEEAGFASDLVLQVHDEVLLDVEPAEADEVAALTQEAMVGAASLWCRSKWRCAGARRGRKPRATEPALRAAPPEPHPRSPLPSAPP